MAISPPRAGPGVVFRALRGDRRLRVRREPAAGLMPHTAGSVRCSVRRWKAVPPRREDRSADAGDPMDLLRQEWSADPRAAPRRSERDVLHGVLSERREANDRTLPLRGRTAAIGSR